jgi:ketopantoate reductase
MLQDIIKGKRTEIASINGAISTEAERQSIAAPVNFVLTELVGALQRKDPFWRAARRGEYGLD